MNAGTSRTRDANGRFTAAPRPASKPAAAATRAKAVPQARATSQSKAAAVLTGLSLYLLRHADAGDSTTWTGDDAARPLSNKGRKQSKRLGAHLGQLGIKVDALVTSPRVRAVDTARLVGKAIGVKPRVDESLSGGFDPTGLRSLLGGLDGAASSVMLVGHDPDFSTLASWLTDAPIALRKGAVVRIDLPNREAIAGSGTLAWLLPPDAIKG